MQFINSFLNNLTTYRLMLYFLLFLVGVAVVFSVLKIIPFDPISILATSFYLTVACKIINQILARIFKVATNIESSLITGLILSLIVGPSQLPNDLLFLTLVAAFAMGSKYILVIKKKHIFNPAGFGVVASAVLLNQGASWWVGNLQMFPVILLGGLLVLKKIRRWELVGAFLVAYIVLSLFTFNFSLLTFNSSPILFFSLVMLVEPVTSPTIRIWQLVYGLVVAVTYFVIPFLLPDAYYGLELSLLVGNIFSYLVSKSFKQSMVLKEKKQLTKDVIAFKFEPSRKFQYKAGQYLEWTLPHKAPDSRGVRRFFTISSSPTEDFIMLTSKFYDKLSTFKQALHKMELGQEIVVSDLAGEFTLPENGSKRLVFIAGGIGVTPFRSMVKWLVDKGEKRDVVFLYSNKTDKDIVFKDLFESAKEFGVRTVYVNTDKDGYIDEKLIKKEVEDFKERTFYISGPEPMVEAFEKMIAAIGVPKNQTERDYFPGYTETHTK